jgi:hypothetical protein
MTDPRQVTAQSDYWQPFFPLEASDRSLGQYARLSDMLISSECVVFE